MLKVQSISRNASDSEMNACHMAFVSGWERGNNNQLVDKLHNAKVLTITERLSNGVIHLFVNRGKVHFDVNEKLARKLGISIRYALIKMSKTSR